ncbi:MAG TPA: hypothetical protein VMT17_06600 [Anaeromyxobacteraceae bacterium]|nr:hypothetical protein [Anaeromyxobacteraceae bacterium]
MTGFDRGRAGRAAVLAALLLAACRSAGGPAREPPEPRPPQGWKSTCTVTCADGTSETITARVAGERMPNDLPCELGDASVQEVCPPASRPARSCGGCSAWVETR